jgi:hypothetical protein
MRAVVVYESMFGNTHVVADHIGEGLQSAFDVVVTSVEGADDETVATADLLVVGGPTHVHGMSSTMSRKSALDVVEKQDDLELDPDAEGPGLRDWFGELNVNRRGPAAAFDTRIDAAAVLTGRASKGIGHRLRKHGFELVADPESFLVDKENHLLSGEAERAAKWGATLAASAEQAFGRSSRPTA